MFKKSAIKYNGYTIQSPNTELPLIEQLASDPLTLTHAKNQNPTGSDFYVRVTDFNVTNVGLDSPTEKRSGTHGSTFGASTINQRTITIEGELVAFGRQGQNLGWRVLNQIFSVEAFPSAKRRGLFKLELKDYADEKFFLYAQLERNFTRLRIETDSPFITRFSVTLRAEDARIFSDEKFLVNVLEGNLGGLNLGESSSGGLATESLNALVAAQAINNDGGIAPTKITISKASGVSTYESDYLAVNPKITNLSGERFFQVEHNMELNDVIIIDTLFGEITLNGAPASNIKVLGSKFIYLIAGANDLVLTDETDYTLFGQNIQASVEFRKILN